MRIRIKKPRSAHLSKTDCDLSKTQPIENAEHADKTSLSFNPHERFRHFAAWSASAAGSPCTFLTATLFLIAWAFSYPLFLRFSNPLDTWQLVINTVTTIVTFLMVFLIQNTQNRDARALHLKMDELIRAVKGARNRLVELENCSDEELDTLKQEFERIHKRAAGKQKELTDQQLARVEMEEKRRNLKD